jgi:non-homologous end joining protein Ku
MLDAKLSGEEIVRPEPAPEAPVIDLMEALKKSVAAAKESETPPKKTAPKASSRAKSKARSAS